MHCPRLGVGEYDVSSSVIWLDPKQEEWSKKGPSLPGRDAPVVPLRGGESHAPSVHSKSHSLLQNFFLSRGYRVFVGYLERRPSRRPKVRHFH